MKHFFLIAALTLCFAAGLGFSGDAVQVSSEITDVTVYTDRAEVTRTFELNLSGASALIEVADLPATLDDTSVSVTGDGAGEATITGLRLERIPHEKTPKGELRELEDKIKALNRDIQAVDDSRTVARHKFNFLERLQTQYVKQESDELMQRADANSMSAMLSLITNGMGDSFITRRTLEKKNEELSEKLDVLNQEYYKKRNPGGKDTKTARLEMKVEKAGRLTMKLKYMIYGATWQPAYNVRIFPDEMKVRIGYSAQVSQRTGEDWENATVTLSTTRPAQGGQLPEARPFQLSFYQPSYRSRAEQKSIVAKTAGVSYNQEGEILIHGARAGDTVFESGSSVPFGVAGVQMMAAEAPASSSGGGGEGRMAAALFEIPVKQTIASGDEPVKVGVAQIELDVEPEYFAVPKVEPYVFLKGKIKNASDYPLLPGEAFVFIENSLVTKTWLEGIMPEQEFDLSFGVYPGLKAEREIVSRKVITKSSKTTREAFAYKITLENHRKVKTTIVIEEAMPVSQHSKITVKMGRISPEPKETDDKNIAHWEIELAPGEETEITWDFTVDYPSGSRLAL